MQKLLYILPLLLFIFSCSPVDDDLLIGEWQAAALYEEGKSIEVDLNEISLSFSNNNYHYTSTLNYRESGSYFVDERFLFTIDTTHRASTEKAVEIQLLSVDSLYLRMQENGKERLLQLAKKK
ncbi:MAG: hypothetical protein AB8G22_19345 [Saprospiraceae bacterium]